MKQLFFDIDGTLMGQSRQVTSKTIAAIRQLRAEGNQVYLCTGRAPVSISKKLLEIGFDGVISSAGGFVEVDGKVIYRNFINQYILSEVMLLFTNHKIMFSLETYDALYQSPGIADFFKTRQQLQAKNNPELARLLEERRNEEIRLPLSAFDLDKTPVTKVCFLSDDKIAFYDTVKYLSEFFNIVIFSKPEDNFINGEIILKNCTKGDALKQVVAYTNSKIEDTIAFGDSMNDYQMMEVAGYRVVSQEAPEKLKKLADDLFENPDQDGIYKSIKKLKILS